VYKLPNTKYQNPNTKIQIPGFKYLDSYTCNLRFKENCYQEIMAVKNNLCERLLKFAVYVIIYLRTVKNTVESMHMKRQLVKSSTSSGANYEESKGSPTRPDVKTKTGISLKEMRESHYFLKIFYQLQFGDAKQCEYLINESAES